MLANDKTGDTALATWGGRPITEIDVTYERLDGLHDIHFGICSDKFDKYVPKEALHGLGPRILDIHNRGGRTAEDAWRLWTSQLAFQNTDDFVNANKGTLDQKEGELNKFALEKGKKIATPGFAEFFLNFRADRPIKPGHDVYPPNAKISGKSVAAEKKYKSDGDFKRAANIVTPGFQFGTQWSKAALEFACQDAWGMVHFHLDGLGDVRDVLAKTGDYSHNVTARELRFVRKNWDRFSESVLFYNGYTPQYKVVMVQPPWI